MGFDPLLWCKFEKIENKSDLEVKLAKTAQIVESAIETIKANLKKLIQQKIIHGKIVSNPDEFGSYFIKMEEEKEFKQKALKDSLSKGREFSVGDLVELDKIVSCPRFFVSSKMFEKIRPYALPFFEKESLKSGRGLYKDGEEDYV